MQWTEKQQQVIDTRNRNLLVSAAAGSGKTAVLVERIIQLISEGEHPLDIDQLLVMTFTNAAAAEMRERISLAIEQKLSQQPENSHLQVQSALVHHAQIMTIDSFCLNLIREHFNLLDIDPAFRIGDEGELLLLKADVMERMLEEYYENGDPVFEQFVDTYATGKSDSGIEDYIMQVYTFAQSNPFPEIWIQDCKRELELTAEGDVRETGWMQYLMRDVKLQLRELAEQLSEAIEVCQEEGGPEVYLPNLQQEYEMLRGLLASEDYDTLNQRLRSASFGRLAAARSKNIDPEKKEYVSSCRDRIKKAVGSLKELYGAQTQEEAVADMLGARDVVLKLLELAEEFSRRYQEMKRDKNIVDFNDLEHYALQILVEPSREDGRLCCTETADELSRQYAEILVDEYQDSNHVQETLIQSLSGERFGRPNVFMVGDVKQSIYKFRLARPELFMEKYETYTAEESSHQKIELHQNFRSRASVLDSINAIFYRIMTKNLGNVEYTKEAALHPGAVFAEYPGEADQQNNCMKKGLQAGTPTELLLVDTGKDAVGPADEELADYTSREIEAKLIAARIRSLMDPERGLAVWDKKKECYRPVGYGDIVILLRSISGWSEAFINVLTQEGIPAYAETGTGYFDTVEVETVLAMLAVVDNPMQDIPLATVLRSPIMGMSEEELAWMMAAYKKEVDKGQDRGIYGAFQYWTKGIQGIDANVGCSVSAAAEEAQQTGEGAGFSKEQTVIRQKLQAFMELWLSLRHEASYLPIHELIYRVYERTGYYDYVTAMPAGETRKANLDMLVEKAAAYEKTSYKGLFQFIRYIHQLKKFETDFGEATAPGKYEDMVRIMSIHKSKGLEFPVVFLAGTGKSFNKQDVRGKLIIDSDLGIGTDYLNLEERTKTSTLKKNVLKRKMDLDNLGEELRVLYVAMTRAKEKLIMTGTDRSLQKKLEKWNSLPTHGPIPYTILTTAGSYLDWILMTNPEAQVQSNSAVDPGADSQVRPLFQVYQVPVESLVAETVERQIEKQVSREELQMLDLNQVYDPRLREQLERSLKFEYPFAADVNLHTKMSVSELKKMGQHMDDFAGLYQPAVPEFLKNRDDSMIIGDDQVVDTVLSKDGQEIKERMDRAAERGTAYHRVLELLDLTKIGGLQDVVSQIAAMVSDQKIAESAAKKVCAHGILTFAESSVGRRMAEAQQKGCCYREQQFVMGLPAREMGLGDSDELVLIQGIIDAYLKEEDGLVVIDYKTDHILPGQEDLLVKRYKTQLDYYQKALEQMTGQAVKERIIYSLELQKEIIC